MSIFTNPASGAKDGAERYIEAVLELVGDADPMGILASTPAEVRALIVDLSSEQLSRPEAPGKWAVREVLQHLADSELVWGYRIRRILAEDGPTLGSFDQDLWAERLHYERADPQLALGMFEGLRAVHLDLIGSATPAELARYAIHEERGRESLEHMARLYAGHDLVHRRQLARLRALSLGEPT